MKHVVISIKAFQSLGDAEDRESFELVTDGEYEHLGDRAELSYIESELTGFAGLKTTFFVEPDRVILSRGSGAQCDMIFCLGKKHHFLYETGYGSILMGLDTHSIEQNLTPDGGTLEIHYTLDFNNMFLSRNSFRIQVR